MGLGPVLVPGDFLAAGQRRTHHDPPRPENVSAIANTTMNRNRARPFYTGFRTLPRNVLSGRKCRVLAGPQSGVFKTRPDT
jgi:hypothetical protein